MKEIALFAAGAIMALLVPVEVSDNLRQAAINLFTFIGRARQAAAAAPPVNGEVMLPAGEAAAAPQPAKAPGDDTAAPAAAPSAPSVTAPAAARAGKAVDSTDYIGAEEAAEILRAFKGDAPDPG